MASSSQPPAKEQATPDTFFSVAGNGSKKRPIMINADDSDEDSGTPRSDPDAGTQRKRPKTGTADSGASDGLDEGEIGESASSNNASAVASEVAGPFAKSHRGWNQGVSNGLRTSFGAKGQNGQNGRKGVAETSADLTASSLDAEEEPESASAPSSTETKADAPEPSSRRLTAEKNAPTWNYPPKHEEWCRPINPPDDNWKARFKIWLAEFVKLNSSRPDIILDLPSVLAAHSFWLKGHKRISEDDKIRAQSRNTRAMNFEGLERRVCEALGLDFYKPTKSHGLKLPPLEPLSQFEIEPADSFAWQKLFIWFCCRIWGSQSKKRNIDWFVGDDKQNFTRIRSAWHDWLVRAKLLESKVQAAEEALKECIRLYASTSKGLAGWAMMFDGSVFKASYGGSNEDLMPRARQDKRDKLDKVEKVDRKRWPSPVPAPMMAPDSGAAPDLCGDAISSKEKPGERQRYFPGIGPDEVFCVACTSHNHIADTCPHLVCAFCQSAEHNRILCPVIHLCDICGEGGHFEGQCSHTDQSVELCSICSRVGHSSDDCSGILREGKNGKCTLCQSGLHDADGCDKLWRTYEPELKTLRKIKSLTAFCCKCGDDGHYGLECKAREGDVADGNAWRTWSEANLSLYLDPDSVEEAVSLSFTPEAIDSDLPDGRPNLGKSIAPQRHVVFEAADDDDDEAFIRPPVQRSAPGSISFQNGGRGFVPPLPPGPPPPLPADPPPPTGPAPPRPRFRGGRFSGRNQNKRGRGGKR